MTKKLDIKNLGFDRLRIGEIRITDIGVNPRTVAKFAFMDEQGHTFGQSMLWTWSPRSLALLKDLVESVEIDCCTTLCRVPEAPEDLSGRTDNAFLHDAPESEGGWDDAEDDMHMG